MNKMKIKYEIIKSEELTDDNIKIFEALLKKQGEIDTTEGKALRCHKVCITQVNDISIAIGALKEVYKRPFEYAGVRELEDKYKYELGYLFVDNTTEKSYRGLGIGKTVSRLLLQEVINENIFATTEFNQNNTMYHILKSFGFESIGKPYLGRTTGKILTLMVLNRTVKKEN